MAVVKGEVVGNITQRHFGDMRDWGVVLELLAQRIWRKRLWKGSFYKGILLPHFCGSRICNFFMLFLTRDFCSRIFAGAGFVFFFFKGFLLPQFCGSRIWV
jgi:hypothetical protein